MITPEVVRLLIRAGHKVQCPFCNKRLMSQNYRPFHISGIGQHIKEKHFSEYGNVLLQSKAYERQVQHEKEQREIEEREQPLRQHVVTGQLIINVINELKHYPA